MNIAVLTAGGIGSRTHQDLPKQFLTVENKPIIIYTLEAFQQHPSIDEIYVSCLEGWSAVLEAYAKQFNIATVYKGNIIKNLIMDCQSYTKYRPNETTGGIFVSWRRKEELPTGA